MNSYLILSDGTVFKGISAGFKGEKIGELVFTTSMGGYMEILTDPSFYGQIILMTFPLVGNYGAITSDRECDKAYAHGFIARELCQTGSNFRKETELNEFLDKQGIAGIVGLDTREITRKIIETGVTNAMISDNKRDLEEKIKAIKAFKVKGAAETTSIKEIEIEGAGDKTVVLWDFGAKLNIKRQLIKKGCKVITVPYNYTAEQIAELKPGGIVLSNGGGDPADNMQVVAEIKKLFAYKIPMFGICMGHQLLSLAMGGKTKKMTLGHRGVNQPVKDLKTGKIYITSQNHGYAVVPSSLPSNASVNMINCNDNTCEGVEFEGMDVFSVQFHPEACSGPNDSNILFDRFLDKVK